MSRGITLSRDAAMAFYTGDKNGDMSLDWDEFVSIVPQLVKEEASMNELRHLFESIDIDNNKSITMDEFFIWTLTFIQQQTGSGIEAVFRRYDKNHEGSLDAREFAMAAEDMGFGDVAHELFLELDPDGSGSVTHSELEHFLKEAARYRKQGCSNNAKKFLTQLAFDSKPKTVDASGWNITATTPEELRDQLLEKAQLHDIRIADLFLIMNPSSEAGTIDRITFPAALKRVGCELSRGQMFANAVFDQLDSDGSGGFGMHDLLQWLKKIEGRLVRSRKLTLVRQPVEGMAMFALGGAQYPCPLDEVDWDSTKLRIALQIMLMNEGLAPLDLLRAWDNDNSGSFSRQEFLVMLKRIVNDQALWDDRMRDVVALTFKEAAAGDKSIDVVEFESWLNHNWLSVREQVKGASGFQAMKRSDGNSTTTKPVKRFHKVPRHGHALLEDYDIGTARGYKGSVYEPRIVTNPTQPKRPGRGLRSRASVLLLPPSPGDPLSLLATPCRSPPGVLAGMGPDKSGRGRRPMSAMMPSPTPLLVTPMHARSFPTRRRPMTPESVRTMAAMKSGGRAGPATLQRPVQPNPARIELWKLARSSSELVYTHR